MKRWMWVLVLAAAAVSSAAQAAPVQVRVDGQPFSFPLPPRLVEDRLLVPVRPLAQRLGFTVSWDPERRTAELRRPERTLLLPAGRAEAVVQEGQARFTVALPVPTRLWGGYLWVPLRAFLEHALPGARVHWDGGRQLAQVWLPLPPRLHPAPAAPAPAGPARPEPPPGPSGSAPSSPPGAGADGSPALPGAAPGREGTGRPRTWTVLSYYTEEEPPSAPEGAYASLLRFGPRMTAVAGFFSRLQVDRYGNATGALEPMSTAPREVRQRVVAHARRAGLPVYLMVHNLLYPGGPSVGQRAAHQVLHRPELRQRLIAHIQQVLRQEGYSGIHLDLEGIAPGDREAYTELVRRLVEALRPAGFQVALSVPAKERDDPRHAWSYPYDYEALGRLADQVAIMAYDYHSFVTGPGPLAPLDWVARVAAYARSTIPPQRVLLGIAAHGFDWPLDGGRPRYLGARQALALARSLGIEPRIDPSRGAHFRYRDAQGRWREVWFETAETAAVKAALARRMGLGGIALWRLGLEDPRLWPVLQEMAKSAP